MFGNSAANRMLPGCASSGFQAAPAGDRPAPPSRSRRFLRGMLSVAVCISTAVITLSIAPAVMAMSDRQDLVRWFNQILDLVGH